MGVVRAHKGMLSKRCRVRGKASHSSLTHQGVNAVAMAARAIAYIDSMAERIAREGPFDHGFEPPHTTLHAGVIHGGTVNNIIPHTCEFEFEIRNLPAHSPLPLFEEVARYVEENLVPKMHAVSADTGFDWETSSDYPGMNTAADDAVIALAADLLDAAGIEPGKVSYGTEGGRFQTAGIPTVICGPGSIEQAHRPNEYVRRRTGLASTVLEPRGQRRRRLAAAAGPRHRQAHRARLGARAGPAVVAPPHRHRFAEMA